MRILLATDAWTPQVNGVVKTMNTVRAELESSGHRFEVVSPDRFRTIPCPTYPEIRLALNPGRRFDRIATAFEPDHIHIATEGPIGFAARSWCVSHGARFTTAFHTCFPESIHLRCGLPVAWTYRAMRWFHSRAERVMVATNSLRTSLARHGFKNIVPWSRGVDTELFRPRPKDFLDFPRPISLYVGRVAVEKNIEAFLRLPLEGTKLVVGDGPALPNLRRQFPQARFVGMKFGEELALHYAASDVFVFPSRTDTFGLVLLEALASGIPVAAYPVTGPIDVVTSREAGVLDEDLERAVRGALRLDPVGCRNFALNHSWRRCAEQFLDYLAPIDGDQVFPKSRVGAKRQLAYSH